MEQKRQKMRPGPQGGRGFVENPQGRVGVGQQSTEAGPRAGPGPRVPGAPGGRPAGCAPASEREEAAQRGPDAGIELSASSLDITEASPEESHILKKLPSI